MIEIIPLDLLFFHPSCASLSTREYYYCGEVTPNATHTYTLINLVV
jgi:hypothetical protein